VLKALARLPADRYAEASQYAEAVQAGAGMVTGGYTTTSTPGLMPSPVTGTHTTTGAATQARGLGGGLSFWEELKRRKVYNVGVVYIAVALALVGIVDAAAEYIAWGGWILMGLAVGFPIALILAWLFEISRDGVQRTGSYQATETSARRWPLLSRRTTIAVVVILAAYGAFQLFRAVL